jgi:uncharacterized Rmd1/YagE family protein
MLPLHTASAQSHLRASASPPSSPTANATRLVVDTQAFEADEERPLLSSSLTSVSTATTGNYGSAAIYMEQDDDEDGYDAGSWERAQSESSGHTSSSKHRATSPGRRGRTLVRHNSAPSEAFPEGSEATRSISASRRGSSTTSTAAAAAAVAAMAPKRVVKLQVGAPGGGAGGGTGSGGPPQVTSGSSKLISKQSRPRKAVATFRQQKVAGTGDGGVAMVGGVGGAALAPSSLLAKVTFSSDIPATKIPSTTLTPHRIGVHVPIDEIDIEKMTKVLGESPAWKDWEFVDHFDVIRLWKKKPPPKGTSNHSLQNHVDEKETTAPTDKTIFIPSGKYPEVYLFSFGAIVLWSFPSQESEEEWIDKHILTPPENDDCLGTSHTEAEKEAATDKLGFTMHPNTMFAAAAKKMAPPPAPNLVDLGTADVVSAPVLSPMNDNPAPLELLTAPSSTAEDFTLNGDAAPLTGTMPPTIDPLDLAVTTLSPTPLLPSVSSTAALITATSALSTSAAVPAPVSAFVIKRDVCTLATVESGERLAISFALAKSSLLSIYEIRVQDTIERNSHIPEEMARTGRIHMTQGQIAREVGRIFLVKHGINLDNALGDTPEEFWEDDRFEPAYDRALKYFEIDKRLSLVNNRLAMIGELHQVLTGESQNHHAVVLEWIVIILIVMEVVLDLLHLGFY